MILCLKQPPDAVQAAIPLEIELEIPTENINGWYFCEIESYTKHSNHYHRYPLLFLDVIPFREQKQKLKITIFIKKLIVINVIPIIRISYANYD